MTAEEMQILEETRNYQLNAIRILNEIRDNIFSLNKKFEVFANLKDPDFHEQFKKFIEDERKKN